MKHPISPILRDLLGFVKIQCRTRLGKHGVGLREPRFERCHAGDQFLPSFYLSDDSGTAGAQDTLAQVRAFPIFLLKALLALILDQRPLDGPLLACYFFAVVLL